VAHRCREIMGFIPSGILIPLCPGYEAGDSRRVSHCSRFPPRDEPKDDPKACSPSSPQPGDCNSWLQGCPRAIRGMHGTALRFLSFALTFIVTIGIHRAFHRYGFCLERRCRRNLLSRFNNVFPQRIARCDSGKNVDATL